MTKLKPCPFCGRKAAERDIKVPGGNGWVGCQRCRCFIDFVKNGKPRAIAAWNRRADAEPVVRGGWIYSRTQSEFAVSKCSACGKEQFSISHVVKDGKYCPNCGAKMEDKP